MLTMAELEVLRRRSDEMEPAFFAGLFTLVMESVNIENLGIRECACASGVVVGD